MSKISFRAVPQRIFLILFWLLSACSPSLAAPASSNSVQSESKESAPIFNPEPTRPPYSPGELVDYLVQDGDTLTALASHFNTTITEIRAANPIIPDGTTTLPPGMPMKIPIYYQPLWGSPYQIIPDARFVNGPANKDFDPIAFVDTQPGWFKNFTVSTTEGEKRGGEIVLHIAEHYSINPQFILAILEYQLSALSEPVMPENLNRGFTLGHREHLKQGLYQQLLWAVNTFNNTYYGWRLGTFHQFELQDGRLERPDPWQNAATVALQYYFSQVLPPDQYLIATHSEGFAAVFSNLFGDPWANVQSLFPGSLQQPEFRLPFETGKAWAYTGGPHTGWGEGEPYAAIDFAPPAVVGGCSETTEYATAVADGVIARKGTAIAVLDLDGDGDERTGWVVFHLHLSTDTIPPVGTVLKAGQPIGKPSCEGGRSTGTHVHIARKYNGEWIPADSAIPFNLEGWIAKNGAEPYQGSLIRFSRTVRACVCSDSASQIQSGALQSSTQ